MSEPCLLVGDIGGTNARFALADIGTTGFSRSQTLRCADFGSAHLAIKAYLEAVQAPTPAVVCLAVAGPIVDGSVRFTNNNWSIGQDELGDELQTAKVRLLNDFEAIAYSIPSLDGSDMMGVGLPPPKSLNAPNYTVGVLGPGTGLGAVALCKRGGQIFPIVGEAGHVGFAPETQLQFEVLRQLRERFERVSDERLLSGPGLENIYWALTKIHGGRTSRLSAADIFAQGLAQSDTRAAETLQLFCEVLGQAAGNLALALGAVDGIYVGGGIVQRQPDLLTNSRFRTGFESKGRHRSLMERIPTQLIVHPQPGLLGGSYCAVEILHGRM